MLESQLQIAEMKQLMNQYLAQGLESASAREKEIYKLPQNQRIFLLSQITLKKKALNKLAPEFHHPMIIIPSRLALEQSSGKKTSEFKQHIAQEFARTNRIDTFIDITGGIGADFIAIAKTIQEITTNSKIIYIEQEELYCNIFRHNLPYLISEIGQIEVINSDSIEWIRQNQSLINKRDTLLFADPARRGQNGEKLYRIEDCLPDLSKAHNFIDNTQSIFKLSPMLDVYNAFKTLPKTHNIICLEEDGEVKELLALSSPGIKAKIVESVDLQNGFRTAVPISEKTKTTINFSAPEEGHFLIIPKPSISKLRLGDYLAQQHGLKKIAPNTNIYLSNHHSKKYSALGRVLEIQTVQPYKKSNKLTGNYNIIPKNFPDKVPDIAKKLRIKEGGPDFIIAFRDFSNKPYIAICRDIINIPYS